MEKQTDKELEDEMKTYCYHCGNILTRDDKFSVGNIHRECYNERIKLTYGLSKERYKILIQDPEIRKKIEEIDKKIIAKRIKEYKK